MQGRDLEEGADTEAMEECYLLAHSTCFHIEPKTTSPEITSPMMGWTLPHQLHMKKMSYRLAYSPILQRHFFFN